MTVYLVTGGTGHLGRHVVDKLRAVAAPDDEVRVLSRSDRGTHRGDLKSGSGITAAVSGVDVVIHCAMGSAHERETRNLVDALTADGGHAHLVFVSIEGIERIPFAYYRWKLAAERVVEASGLAFTTLRTVQFHSLVRSVLDVRGPAIFAFSFSVQPIDEADVAGLLVDIARKPPAGRLAPIAGPRVQTVRSLAEDVKAVRGWPRKPIIPIRLPGKIFRGYRAGYNLVPGNPFPGRTFREYLQDAVD